MLLIRRFEERVVDLVNANEIAGVTHEYVGQEAVAAGVCAALRADDVITSTHRGPRARDREGRRRPADDGRAARPRRRAEPRARRLDARRRPRRSASTARTASSPRARRSPPAQRGRPADGTDRVAVTFFGDGGANQGVLHETMNLAALWRLPVVFVCENNGYAVTLPQERSTAGSLVERAAAYGMAAEQRRRHGRRGGARRGAGAPSTAARAGGGPDVPRVPAPTASSATTPAERTMKLGYRTDEEIERWRERDPLPRPGARLDRGRARARSTPRSRRCSTRRSRSPARARSPDPADALDFVYASGPAARGGGRR